MCRNAFSHPLWTPVKIIIKQSWSTRRAALYSPSNFQQNYCETILISLPAKRHPIISCSPIWPRWEFSAPYHGRNSLWSSVIPLNACIHITTTSNPWDTEKKRAIGKTCRLWKIGYAMTCVLSKQQEFCHRT